MNFTQYMNQRIFASYSSRYTVAIGEQKTSAYHADLYVDIANADYICDLERDMPEVSAHHVRLGEVLEHLTTDAALLRHLRARCSSILVTVPYNAPADYHVRLHNDWSVRKLLSVTGWRVVTYIPRKSPRLDRLIWLIRGVFGQRVNALFFWLNPYLPIKPNGGYYYCVKSSPVSISEINARQFGGR